MKPIGGQLEQGSIIAGYRIDELISRGGMGVVYRATNVALNRIYAVKVLAPELSEDDHFRERFKREIRTAASLDHPHIVGIHYAGEHDGLLFLVMDFIDGTDLRRLIKGGAFDAERAVALLSQVASALDAAHRKGLVHRDVKPANVLVTVRDGQEHAYLTDFGLAKRSDSVSGFTAQGAVVGTVDYMAPEQITGGHTDARTDVYGLGCVFFQMLTGKIPYERDNSVATLFAHVHEPPPPLDPQLLEAYPDFNPVIEQAMAKDPTGRYLSAGDLARDATAALSGMRYMGAPSVVGIGDASPVVPEPGPDRTVASGPERASDTSAGATAAGPTAAGATAAGATAAGATAAGATVAADSSPGPRRGPLRRYRWAAAALVAVAAVVVAVVIAAGSGGGPGSNVSATPGFVSPVRPVPTNQVTGSGTATLVMSGDQATVTLRTNGLLNGSAHAMHIHAGAQGVCPPASAARLHNGHLAISTTDGLKFYGPPLEALTTTGDTSPRSILAFSRYPTVGAIAYKRTMAVTPQLAAQIRSGNAVVVVHGIDYNHNGIYDNVLNRSELSNALPGEATAPALCGSLFSTKEMPTASRGAVFVAALHTYPGSPSPATPPAFLCHTPGVAEGRTALRF